VRILLTATRFGDLRRGIRMPKDKDFGCNAARDPNSPAMAHQINGAHRADYRPIPRVTSAVSGFQ
jgi:hypothetical protein